MNPGVILLHMDFILEHFVGEIADLDAPNISCAWITVGKLFVKSHAVILKRNAISDMKHVWSIFRFSYISLLIGSDLTCLKRFGLLAFLCVFVKISLLERKANVLVAQGVKEIWQQADAERFPRSTPLVTLKLRGSGRPGSCPPRRR